MPAFQFGKSKRGKEEVIRRTIITAMLSIAMLSAAETVSFGTFSVSLTVKDMKKSREFYENLGFQMAPPAGTGEAWRKYGEQWVILKNGEAIIGLFQGMFDKNTLTFNPSDVRGIQSALKERGVKFTVEATPGKGPAFALLTDPDGNPVLLDQH
jgi:lactoylglutathione lyase